MARFKFLERIADRYILSRAETLANDIVTGRRTIAAGSTERFLDMLRERTIGNIYATGHIAGKLGQYVGTYNPDEISMETYEKMRFDPQFHAGLQAIKLPILHLQWGVESSSDEIKDFVVDALDNLWRSLMRSILTALDFGFAAHEKVWQVDNREVTNPTIGKIDSPALTLKKLKSLHPCTVEMIVDRNGNFAGFQQYPYRLTAYGTVAQGQNSLDVVIPPEKAFVFTHDYEFGNLYGFPRPKPGYPIWFEYWIVQGLSERYLERYGTPTKKVTAPAGRSQTSVDASGNPVYEDNQTIAERAAASILPDGVVSLPATAKDSPQWTLEYLQDSTQGRNAQFLDMMKYLDNLKLRSLFVPERVLTQEFATGSGTAVEQQLWIFVKSIQALVQEIEDAINNYIVRDLVLFNFGRNAPKTRLVIENLSKEKEAFLAAIYGKMVEKGVALPDVHAIETMLRIPKSEKVPVPLTPQGVPIPTQPTQAGTESVEDVSILASEIIANPVAEICNQERAARRLNWSREVFDV